MNILIIGKPQTNLIKLIKESKHLDKLYTAGDYYTDGIPHIEFFSIEELIKKAKTLQIDIAINMQKELISQNICAKFKQNKINLISVNEKWLNLESSPFAAKQLLTHYSVNTPKLIHIPVTFPVTMKNNNTETIINSMQEVTNILESLQNKNYYFEETIVGEEFNLPLIWDGKNVFYFNYLVSVNEVQEDRLDLLKTKITFLLSDEKADFTGFLNLNLVWAKNDWYVKNIQASLDETLEFNCFNFDFLYILNSAIYQKLNEIVL